MDSHTFPRNTEQKEIKIELNRDSYKYISSPSFSQETIKHLVKELGKDRVVQELRFKGWTEDQLNSSLKSHGTC
jgi:hypothetical protein